MERRTTDASQRPLTYADKLRYATKEAKATLVALALTAAVWAVCGFGVARFDITVLHTPLWIICGTLGTWAFAIAASVFLAKRVFLGGSFDDDVPASAGDAGHPAAAADACHPGAADDARHSAAADAAGPCGEAEAMR